MNNRRSSIEVIADILKLGKAGKTEIMYSANMSHRQLRQYLDFLTQREFINVYKVGNPKTTYAVTPLGLRVLQQIEGLLETLDLGNHQ